MKNISINKSALTLAMSVATIGVIAVATVQQWEAGVMAQKLPEVVKLDVDHKQYGDVGSLRRDADVIVRGTVLNSGDTVQGPSTTSPDGRIIPSIPQTNFAVSVEKVLKGKITVAKVTVSLTGGVKDGLDYQVEDMPWLTKTQRAIFFLKDGGNGVYYPIAGGAGIGKQGKISGSYDLPKTVSGNSIVNVTEDTLAGQ